MDDTTELKPKRRKISYISTGLSDLDRSFPLLQDMQDMLDDKPDMTAAELLAEVERQISADKTKRMKREAAKYAAAQEDD